jgi:SAM-dependent methyltransferase
VSGLPDAGRRPAGQEETVAANRSWWDDEAAAYHAEHGEFLGDVGFVWGPEGWTEDDLALLGLTAGQRVLEFGAGAGQCSRWIRATHPEISVVASDLSLGMLRVGGMLNERSGVGVPLAQCDATRLPFADGSFDVVFSSYGAVPFVADSAALMAECARVLRPGGQLVFSTTHPIRWALPDVPGPAGLEVRQSYFDRTPYVETTDGTVAYAEHHRTIGDRVREVVAAGLVVVDLVEPEWPERNAETWGGWSPLRGRLLPGTLIVVAVRP